MLKIRHALGALLLSAGLCGLAPTLANAESSHELRQDHLIRATLSQLSTLSSAVSSVTKTVSSLGQQVTSLAGQVTSLTGSVAKIQAQLVPEYGIGRALLAQSGGSALGLPSLYTSQIPRDGIDPAVSSGEVLIQCATAPCKLTLLGAVRSSRPVPTAAAAPGEIGGGVLVHSATTGALVAAGNILGDGKHTGKVVNLQNVGQVPVASVDNSQLTPVGFDPAAGNGINVASDGSITIPATGSYTVTGTLFFYDLDNVPAAAKDRASADRGARRS